MKPFVTRGPVSYDKKGYFLVVCLSFLSFFSASSSCFSQTFDWARSMGGAGTDQGLAITVDANGNEYVTGYFATAADFDAGGSAGALFAAGNNDIFLAKYDPNGIFLWAKSMGGLSDDQGWGIAVDDHGNVYVTGYFSLTADFNSGGSDGMLTATGSNDVFLAKYDPSGVFLWAKSMGGADNDQGLGVTVDNNDNVYITGYFASATADFNPGGIGGTIISAGAGLNDVFLAKYDSSGAFLWTKGMGGVNSEQGKGVAVDGSGNVYVTGIFGDTIDFNPGGSGGTLITAGSFDVFLTKYDSNGAFLWAKSMGGTSSENDYAVAVDGNGNVYITGRFKGTADFNPGGSGGTVTSIGNYDIFLVKRDSNGAFLWMKGMGGASIDIGMGIAVDGADNVYLTGYFASATTNFNPGGSGGTLNSAGSYDVFLAKYDPTGTFLHAKNMGGTDRDVGQVVAVDNHGNVCIIGHFSSTTADFNPGGSGGTLTNTNTYGEDDVFVVRFTCNDTSSSYLSVSACKNYKLNDSVYTASGTYTQVFPNTAGCDSTVILDLILTPIAKPSININGFVLGVTGTYATYQWTKDGALIPGATDSTYTVTANGNYQVIVTNENDCSDTSDVYPITNYTGMKDIDAIAQQINVYPNPAADIVYIQAPVKVNAILTDIAGKTIRKVKNADHVSLKNLASGIYLLRITDESGTLIKVVKAVKQDQ